MEDQDFSLKNLAIIGMLIGGFFWWSHRGSASADADRTPSAFEQGHARFRDESVKVKETYHPNLPPPTIDENSARAAQAAGPQVNVNNDEKAAYPAGSEPAAEFASTRNEITKDLAEGRMDEALELARRKLEDNIEGSNEIAFMGFLHEFIMKNSEDSEEKFNVTLTALKTTRDPNVRRYIYQKFNSYKPDMSEDLNHELENSGITINN